MGTGFIYLNASSFCLGRLCRLLFVKGIMYNRMNNGEQESLLMRNGYGSSLLQRTLSSSSNLSSLYLRLHSLSRLIITFQHVAGVIIISL